MASWTNAGKVSTFDKKEINPIELSGLELIVVFDKENTPHCYKDLCSHQIVKLSEYGEIIDSQLVCHAHAAKFCLSSGNPLCEPAKKPIEKFDVKIENENIFIMI